jgi:DNA-binding IscR family transcriptional regulator
VIRVIEGPVYPISCVDPEAPPTCDFVSRCAFHSIWKEVGEKIAQIVDTVNFEQLQQKASRLKEKEAIMYYI